MRGEGGEPINMALLFGRTRIHPLQIYTFTLTFLQIGLHISIWRCLLEMCVNRRETLLILRQWHEKCVQYNLELTPITKSK